MIPCKNCQHTHAIKNGFVCQAALQGKQVAGLEPAAYGGYKDVHEAWMAGMPTLDDGTAMWNVTAG